MKSIMSVGNKFFDKITPIDLVNMILTSKYTKGVELYINIDKKEEMKYLEDIVPLLKNNGLAMQIHGNVELKFEEQVKFMKILEKYSDFLEAPIIVTLHTIFDKDLDVSIKKSVEYLSDLTRQIDNSKVVIALENLNSVKNLVRLSKEQIRPIVLNNEDLYFTYDIGHSIVDYEGITNLDKFMIEQMRNVHLHTCDRLGQDHRPIYKNDSRWNDIIKALLFLKNNKYQYNITFEYDLYACKGETIKEKINDYLTSIDYISERFN